MNTDGHGWEGEEDTNFTNEHEFFEGRERRQENLETEKWGILMPENLRGLRKLLWIVVRMNTDFEQERTEGTEMTESQRNSDTTEADRGCPQPQRFRMRRHTQTTIRH